MYRSPSTSPLKFIEEMETRLKLLSKHKNKHIIFTSDSNIDLLNYEHSEPVSRLVDLYTQYGFVPVISRPTHFSHIGQKPTLIDHIFSNCCDRITSSGILTNPVADHLGIYITLLIDSDRPNSKFSKTDKTVHMNRRDMSKDNLDKFKEKLRQTDWNDIIDSTNAQTKFEKFSNVYTKIYDSCFPKLGNSRGKNRCKNSKPWILPWLSGACSRKNKAYNKYIKCPSLENKSKYQKLKKFTEKHIKKAKLQYYTDYFKKYASDGRKQWQMINSLLNRNQSKHKVNKIITEHKTLTKNSEIASAFNTYFTNIASTLKSELYSQTNSTVRTTTDPQRRVTEDMKLIDCSPIEISEIIKTFKNKATSDTAVQALKHTNQIVSPIICNIITASFEQGIFPSELKLAKVIPLHKSGSRSELSNYRPISLLPLFSKIYEKAMHKRLYHHLEQNNSIFNAQFGFRAGHSCEHALLTAQNSILSTLNKKEVAVLLLIDFSKAFDMVDHKILLNKLEHYGVRSNLLQWFKSYLTDRRQFVKVNETESSTLNLSHGVPQGSILGPLLFIIYINDMPQISNLAQFILYADDANIIVTGKNLREIEQTISILIPLLLDWIFCNGLKLNIKKTKYLIFSNCSTHDINITISNTKIERKTSERFLGVIMDENLNWNAHRAALATKISRNAAIMFKLRGTIPQKILRTLYFSFIQSHLCFCPSVWGLGSRNSLVKIFSAQKKAIRGIIAGYSNYYYNNDTGEIPTHTKTIFNKYEILTVHNLILLQTMTTMSKIYRNITPIAVRSLFSKTTNNNTAQIRPSRSQTNFFDIERTRLVSQDHTIYNKGPRLFNKLVNSINKVIISENAALTDDKYRQPLLQNRFTNGFKSKLKAHILTGQKIAEANTWANENFLLYQL